MVLRLTRPLLTQCLRTQQKRCAISCSRSLAFTASKEHVKSGIRMTESRLILGQPQIRQFAEKPASHSKIENMVTGRPLVVFMKGTPEQPMCGFSNAVCQILRMHGVPPFDSYNVLEDEEIRQGIKEFSNWPTIPQVYIGGEFVGGCDIMIDMHKNGELIEELKKVGIKSDLDE